MANTIRIKRKSGTGAPSTLENAELAYGEGNEILYYGKGTGGSGGSATDPAHAIGGPGAFTTLTTAQTISGNKTFTGTVTLPTLASLTTSGNATIGGNLTVNGTTTTINSTTVAIDDKNFQVATGSADDSAANGGGFTIVSGDGNKTWNFEATGDNWGASENINIASGKSYKINNTSVLSATALGSAVVGSSLTSVGTITSGTWQGTTIATAQGGSGQTSYSNGQLLIGKNNGSLAKATLTAGANVTITNSDGGIEIASSGGASVAAGDGIDVSGSTVSTDLKANGGLVIESTEVAVDLGASSITGTLAVADGGTGSTSASNARTALGVAIGSDVQAYNAILADLAGLTQATDKLPYFSSSSAAATTSLSSFGRTLIDDADASTARTTLGVAIGSNVQAYDAQLNDVAGLAVTDGGFIVGNGSNFVLESGSTARTSLGLGSMATQANTAVDIDGGTIDGITINGGTY